MVCFVCNGKGYVRINDHELPCFECQGRGEFLHTEDKHPQPFESEQGDCEPPCERASLGG